MNLLLEPQKFLLLQAHLLELLVEFLLVLGCTRFRFHKTAVQFEHLVEPIAILLFQLLLKLAILCLELKVLDDEEFDRGGVVGRWGRSAEKVECLGACVVLLLMVIVYIYRYGIESRYYDVGSRENGFAEGRSNGLYRGGGASLPRAQLSGTDLL